MQILHYSYHIVHLHDPDALLQALLLNASHSADCEIHEDCFSVPVFVVCLRMLCRVCMCVFHW